MRNLFQRLENRNALNAVKRDLLGLSLADHENLLAKLEKPLSQVLIADLKQTTISLFFFQLNK